MIYTDMQERDYRSLEFLNCSSLKDFIKNPFFYYQKHILKIIDSEYSPAMAFGSALHCAILEPDVFQARYVVKPKSLNLATKEGILWKKENSFKSILSESEMKTINLLHARLLDVFPKSLMAATNQYKEVVLTSVDDNFLDLKGKVDWLIIKDEVAINIDLKTCNSLADKDIVSSIINFSYDLQGAFYEKLIKDNFDKPVITYLIFMDKSTLDVKIVDITNFVNAVKHKLENCLAYYSKCKTLKRWTSINQGISSLEIPQWYKDRS